MVWGAWGRASGTNHCLMLLKAEQLEAQREASAKALLLRWTEEGHRAEAQQRDLRPGSSEACRIQLGWATLRGTRRSPSATAMLTCILACTSTSQGISSRVHEKQRTRP